MKNFLLIALLFIQTIAFSQEADYPVDPASVEQPGVPKGEIIKFIFDHSTIYPGTWRECSVYVPVQYKPATPACVYINQDGIQWKTPTVFDNLINSKEMPVTIGVFITPGRLRATDTAKGLDRFNRSFEYDGLGDAYARFVLEEILPEVERHTTSDGRAIHLSKNGNDRALGGSSSGAICAFTAAWERPKEFSRVFSAIGTYVGLRGGNIYSTFIRKYEPKPLRVFLQDGSNDNNIYAGDWFKANESMERSLTFAGYEVSHAWGEGAHSGKQGTAIFPSVMRWLWKDWPKPVSKGNSKNQMLGDILLPGKEWELAGEGYTFTEGIAANAAGEVYFQDIPRSNTYKIALNGKISKLPLNSKKSSATCFGTDGKRYVVAGETKQILSYDTKEKESVVADTTSGNDLVVAKNGNIYVTAPDGRERSSKLYLIRQDGVKILVDEGLKFANGIALTPDQTQLYVTESATHWVWIYKIQPDGMLAYKQRYGWLHVADTDDNAWPDGLKCDRDGRIYVTTRLGLQVLDQTGRVNLILPLPSGQPSNVCFGGANFDMLYVTCGDKIYRRQVKVRGANPFENPVKPLNPRL